MSQAGSLTAEVASGTEQYRRHMPPLFQVLDLSIAMDEQSLTASSTTFKLQPHNPVTGAGKGGGGFQREKVRRDLRTSHKSRRNPQRQRQTKIS